jgi:hypothetical protein
VTLGYQLELACRRINMKKLLLILMTLALAAHAQTPMSDAEMKALMVGTWKGEGENNEVTNTFTSDGKWLTTDPAFPNADPNDYYRWDIQNGQLLQIHPPRSDRPYEIAILDEDKCVLHWGHHGGGCTFWLRQKEPDKTQAPHDAELKALLVGEWKSYNNDAITVYKEDGTIIIYKDGTRIDSSGVKWDIKDGNLVEVNKDTTITYAIRFLTKHECLIQEDKDGDYFFDTRYDKD